MAKTNVWRDALFQVINGHILEFDLLSTIDIGGIGENANGHAGAGDVGKSGGTRLVQIPK